MDTRPNGPFDEPLERGCACLIEDQGAQIVWLCLEANPVMSLFALNQINAVPFLGNSGTLHLKSRQREVRHIHRAPDGTQFRCLGADILAAATLAEQFIDAALFERSLGILDAFFVETHRFAPNCLAHNGNRNWKRNSTFQARLPLGVSCSSPIPARSEQ